MSVDAIILAGGRSSRLGGVAKASLLRDGRTLLQLAIDAAARAGGRIVVVGPETATSTTVRFVREQPPFGGPAAAIAAGLATLGAVASADRSPLVAVLACDMPLAGSALAAVLAAATHDADPATDGWVAVDDVGRAQQLLAVYRRDALQDAAATVAAGRDGGDLSGVAVRQLVGRLVLREVCVAGSGSADVDTWADAAALGVTADPTHHAHPTHQAEPSRRAIRSRRADPTHRTEEPTP